MKYQKWLDVTNPRGPNTTAKERDRRRDVRKRVLASADTTIGTLKVARCRGSIGKNLMDRLIAATANEAEKITE